MIKLKAQWVEVQFSKAILIVEITIITRSLKILIPNLVLVGSDCSDF